MRLLNGSNQKLEAISFPFQGCFWMDPDEIFLEQVPSFAVHHTGIAPVSTNQR